MWSRHSLTQNHEREYINSLISRTVFYVKTKGQNPRNISNTFWPNNRRKLSRTFRYKLHLLLCCETAFFMTVFIIIMFYWNLFTAQHLNKVAVNYGWRGGFVSAVVQLSVLQNCGTSCSNSYMHRITPVYSLPHFKKKRKKIRWYHKQVGIEISNAAKPLSSSAYHQLIMY